MNSADASSVELVELISLFYSRLSDLGQFTGVTAESCSDAYQRMLAHSAHMTVTLEKRHESPVSVDVLESRTTESHYLRKIILRRTSDNRVVQYGIVRLALNALKPVVRDEIMAQETPLGRVLINHNVLRQVQLNALWKVECGQELTEIFEIPEKSSTKFSGETVEKIAGAPAEKLVTFGRTALIYCDGEPAVELLEIVAPEESF